MMARRIRRTSPPVGGPYVALAVFCEKVLVEGDGVLTLVRVVDRWTVVSAPEPTPLAEGPLAVIQAIAVVSLKAGTWRGQYTLTIQPTSPSGERLPSIQLPVLLEGDDRGVVARLPIHFGIHEFGLYWFDVKLEEQLLTRMSLRVIQGPRLQSGPTP